MMGKKSYLSIVTFPGTHFVAVSILDRNELNINVVAAEEIVFTRRGLIYGLDSRDYAGNIDS